MVCPVRPPAPRCRGNYPPQQIHGGSTRPIPTARKENPMRWNGRTIWLLLSVLLVVATLTWAATPPAPKVSSFAPAKETVVRRISTSPNSTRPWLARRNIRMRVEGGNIAQDANTLIVVAQALGLHDQDNKYKDPAAALVGAARQWRPPRISTPQRRPWPSQPAAAGQIKTAGASSRGNDWLRWSN